MSESCCSVGMNRGQPDNRKDTKMVIVAMMDTNIISTPVREGSLSFMMYFVTSNLLKDV